MPDGWTGDSRFDVTYPGILPIFPLYFPKKGVFPCHIPTVFPDFVEFLHFIQSLHLWVVLPPIPSPLNPLKSWNPHRSYLSRDSSRVTSSASPRKNSIRPASITNAPSTEPGAGGWRTWWTWWSCTAVLLECSWSTRIYLDATQILESLPHPIQKLLSHGISIIKNHLDLLWSTS